MNLSWYLFYGRQMGMSKQEILVTPYGEMRDMIACLSIYNGTARQKITESKDMTYDEVMNMR